LFSTNTPDTPSSSGSYLDALSNNVSSEPKLAAYSGSYLDNLARTSSTPVKEEEPAAELPTRPVKIQAGEKPFFTTFIPKPPVRLRGRPPVPKDLSKPRLERIMGRTSDAQ